MHTFFLYPQQSGAVNNEHAAISRSNIVIFYVFNVKCFDHSLVIHVDSDH